MVNIVTSISTIIEDLSRERERLIIAIDGRCASGKTTLAKVIQEKYHCNVIHMDHFFLRTEQRTEERLNAAGENIDHERFLEEVLLPLREGITLSYQPYDCGTGQLSEPIIIEPKLVNIIEGSYSCHDKLWEYYDIKIFLTVAPEEQLRRIVLRNGAKTAEIFKNRWIPMEEKYFSECQIVQRCNYRFET